MLDKVISMDQDAPSLRALFDRASRPDGSSCAPWAKLSSALCRNAWLTSDCVIGSGMREGPLGFMQEYTAELRWWHPCAEGPNTPQSVGPEMQHGQKTQVTGFQ